MLKALFGCKSVERVLLYLLVNETCYAHQLHRELSIPLTPIQKALARLEEGGIITSTYQGKTRWYRFNVKYPLLSEVEALLKTAYNQLSLGEKKQYYYLQDTKKGERRKRQTLLELTWNQLRKVSRVVLLARSYSKYTDTWQRKGDGLVKVKDEGQALIFAEQGRWQDDITYSNAFRWTWNRSKDVLSLEHLRFGENNPVFLFHLVATEKNCLESQKPHLCGEDTYFGWVRCSDLFLQMHIRTIGPHKNEMIEYVYT